jgi:starch phosphorylase
MTGQSSGTAQTPSTPLRLWSAATPDYFDFQQFSSGDFVGALAETLTAETLTRVLYG